MNTTVHRPLACDDCHVVPTAMNDRGHADKDRADVVFTNPLSTGVATAKGAQPSWNSSAATCSGVYCHGATLAGGNRTSPSWTDASAQADCGACHGAPPPRSSRHPPASRAAPASCRPCHPGTVTAAGAIDVAGGKHVNGIVEVDDSAMTCSTCHGGTLTGTDADGVSIAGAPPSDTAGSTSTAARGVGAHAAHLTRKSVTANVTCASCHGPVPTSIAHSNGTVETLERSPTRRCT